MKNMITMMATVALAASALGQSVYSGNIVGYTKVQLSAGRTDMIGMQFIEVGGANALNIQDIVLIDPTDAEDIIRFWNPTSKTYTTATYYDETRISGLGYVGGPGWGNNSEYRLDDDIPAGQGFWAQTDATTFCMVKGQVIAPEDNELELDAGKLDFICNPFPCSISIQDIVINNPTDAEDIIRFWNPTSKTYTTATYYDETRISGLGYVGGAGWGDNSEYRLDVDFDIGKGFWIQVCENTSVGFKVPAALE